MSRRLTHVLSFLLDVVVMVGLALAVAAPVASWVTGDAWSEYATPLAFAATLYGWGRNHVRRCQVQHSFSVVLDHATKVNDHLRDRVDALTKANADLLKETEVMGEVIVDYERARRAG